MKHFVRFCLFSCTIAWASVVSAAVRPADFRFFAAIEGQLTLKVPARLPIPGAVITETSRHFSDLRLFDDTGAETPYVIYEQNALPRTSFIFNVLSYSQREDKEEIVLERPPNTAAGQEIAFFTAARNFKKSVEVQASDDLITWRSLATDVIFDFSSRIDLRKTTINLPEANVAYLKILLQDDATPTASKPEMRVSSDGWEVLVQGVKTKEFHIDRIEGHSSATPATAQVYDHIQLTNLDVMIDKEGNTIVRLGQVNLPITAVTLMVENMYYYRRVSLWAADTDSEEAYRQVADGFVYKIPGMNKPEDTLRYDQVQRPFLRLKIFNGDNPPLRLQQVEVAWGRRYLYFIPEAGRHYLLYFGNDHVALPDYELKNVLSTSLAALPYTELSTEAVQPNPDYHPSLARSTQEQIEKALLISVVLLLAGVMSVWVYRLMKSLPVRPRDG
ncbi:MAG: DUF3999 family protein [Deltaproteobacteria bacterium]|nr:DUF3999 family protein [Deltaproteobacteria bacterium]